MACKICGHDVATYRERSRMFLCASCHKGTPAKASREEFERLYWEGNAAIVPESTRRDFWEDYRASTIGPVKKYIERTTSQSF